MQTQNKELNFEGQNIFIGIDVHLKSWNVSIFTENLHHKTFQQPAVAEVLSDYLRLNFPNGIYHSVYEAEFSGLWIHYKLKGLGIDNIVVNPVDVPITGKEKMHKTDKVDSNKLGRSLRSNELQGIFTPSQETMENRSLIRVRGSIVKDLVRLKLRIKAMLYYYGIKFPNEFQKSSTHWSNRFMNWLKEIRFQYDSGTSALNFLINQAEQQRALLLITTKKIKALSQSEAYFKKMELIRSVPGIGMITGILFLIEIEDIKRFENEDKFASLIGIVPNCHSSGEVERKGEMTPRGNNFLRTALIECAWKAASIDPALSKAFSDYCKRMDSNKAIVRIARKLSNRIYTVLKNEIKYEPRIVKLHLQTK
ncbi:MAG: IS110 family transposase [Paludibacter sp.]|nr:IS110 family transposase [Paludibacter sp.]